MSDSGHHPHPHHPPQGLDDRTSKAGLRAVASFEALKGCAVLALGIALLAVHSHVQELAENLLYHLHIDFDRHMGHALLDAATTLSDARWWTISAAVGSYTTVRFIEAWGLWNRRVWAEWFALLSGALYLPWESLKLIEKVTWDRIAVIVINLIIILYMAYIRVREVRGREAEERQAEHAKAAMR